MTRSKLISVLAMFLLSAVLSADAWLIKDSRSDGKIFLPLEYGKALQLASLELQNFLEQMSGARLPFAWGARGRSESGIVLEVRQEAEWKGKESPQAFTIETQERPYPLVTIRGNTSLAVLYGVYQYLENLGIRFLAPGESGTNIPGTDGIRVVKGKKKYTPSFEMRTFSLSSTAGNHFAGNGPSAVRDYQLWLLRNRAHLSRFAAKGFDFGKSPYIAGHYIKPMTDLTPKAVRQGLMEKEPERFALVTGADFVRKRRYHDGQICFSNPRNLDTAVKNALAYCKRHENNKDDLASLLTVPLGLSDTEGICECPECAKTAGTEPYSKDRLVWTFYNRVAKAVSEKYPHRFITVHSPYLELKCPPAGFKAEKNIYCMACFVYSHEKNALNEPSYPFSGTYSKELRQIRDAGAKLTFYCYTNFPWSPTTMQILSAAARCREMGMSMFEVENMNRAEYVWPLIRSLAQYTWNSSRSPEECLQTFCKEYFGKEAGDSIYEFYVGMTRNSHVMERINFGSAADTAYLLPDSFIAEYRPLLSRLARNASGKEKIRLDRFRRAMEGMFRMAETYRSYAKALNTRKADDIADFRRRAEDIRKYWIREKMDEISSGDRTLYDLAGMLLKTDFSSLKPHPRKELAGKRAGDLRYLQELFAGIRPPENPENLFPLPENWKFHIDADASGETRGLVKPEYDDSKDFQEISTWNTPSGQGYANQTGGYFYYRVRFRAPKFPAGKKVFLRIGSIDDTGVIFLNGREVGRQDDPRNWNKSFEMDVTDVLRQGEDNLLAVRGYDSGGGEGVWRPSALYTK